MMVTPGFDLFVQRVLLLNLLDLRAMMLDARDLEEAMASGPTCFCCDNRFIGAGSFCEGCDARLRREMAIPDGLV